jgi:methyl-accepting chemotaxis protein
LSSFRKSVVQVNATGKSVVTFEVGKAGLSLRAVTSVKNDSNQQLGSLEFMQGLNSVAKDFDKSNSAFILLMNEKVKIAPIAEDRRFKNYGISQKYINKVFLSDAKTLDLKQLFHNGYLVSDNYLYTFIDIKDFQDKKLGIALLGKPLSIVNKAINDAEVIIDIALALIALIAVLICIVSSLIIRKFVSRPLKVFEDGVLDFFLFIERKKSDVKPIEIHSEDEIGHMSKIINENITHIKKGLELDRKVLDEVEDIIDKIDNGFFMYQIKSSTTNKEVETLKEKINILNKNFNDKMNIIITALMEFGSANFSYKIDDSIKMSGVYGSLKSTATLIGTNVSELLAMIMNSGDKLNNDTNTLSNASNTLAKAANQQAASLEETAAALEEITSTITNNTEHIQQMNLLAGEVNSSVTQGENLANQTNRSMEEIDVKVKAINEAIAIIDQIAFQTNILSLNAAVEAATAGEAGKGFAVVAQEVRNLAARSADAAKDIKELVEDATSKADEGKEIANQMIHGYHLLNDKIAQTISLISDVSSASKEQEAGIHQINDAVTELDQATQQNAAQATEISRLSGEISQLSDDLVKVANRAKYKEDTRKQVCDVDLVYTTAQLKNDHIRFKEANYQKLGNKQSWSVTNHHECNLGKWIDKAEKNGEDFTRTQNWKTLKEVHEKVHSGVQNFINEDAKNSLNSVLEDIAHEIENATLGVFNTLNIVKADHCQHMGTVDKDNHIVSFSYTGPERRKEQKTFNGIDRRKNRSNNNTANQSQTPKPNTMKQVVSMNDNNDSEWKSF